MNVALISLNVSYVHKNLGLRWLYVAKPQHIEAKILEYSLKQVDACVQEILASDFDVVGLSCFIFNVKESIELIQKLKTHKPKLKIYCGGPEATYHPELFFNLPIEGILRGEAEFSFWKAIEGLDTAGFQRKLEEKVSILRTDLKELEKLESPYFLDFDQKEMNQRFLYMEASRGCPYGCTYCMASLDRKVRMFSLSHLKTNILKLNDFNVFQVKFLDRTFNLNPDFSLEIAKTCVQVKSSTNFHVELVGDQIREDLLNFFIEHHDRFRMEIGVQSFDTEVLKKVGRFSNLTKLKEVIARFASVNAIQHTDLIAGLPTESLEGLKSSFFQLFELKPYEIQLGILKLLNGTLLYDQIDGMGYTFEKEAPYQVIENPWMSSLDIKQVEYAALAVEKTYNANKLKTILMESFIDDPNVFDVFVMMGKAISCLNHPYGMDQLYLALFEVLKDKVENARYLFELDYYQHFKLKPKRLFEDKHRNNVKADIQAFVKRHPELSKASFVRLINPQQDIEFIVYQDETCYHVKV
jgi:anaerobic magnesium-protoporphyrin IX monomethyl ester cyclase